MSYVWLVGLTPTGLEKVLGGRRRQQLMQPVHFGVDGSVCGWFVEVTPHRLSRWCCSGCQVQQLCTQCWAGAWQ
jgi:hypothetical protein